MGMPEIPPLKNGEYIHFEYAQAQRDHADGPMLYFTNMVEIADTREKAIKKAVALLAHEDVYAIHLRRLDQPVQGVHVYDETQPLAVAQNQAYRDRVVAEATTHAYGKLQASKHAMETEYERQIARHEIQVSALNEVIEALAGALEEIRKQADNAQMDAVYLEPTDIARMARVNVKALRDSEIRKARLKSRTHTSEKPWIGSADGTGEPDAIGGWDGH